MRYYLLQLFFYFMFHLVFCLSSIYFANGINLRSIAAAKNTGKLFTRSTSPSITMINVYFKSNEAEKVIIHVMCLNTEFYCSQCVCTCEWFSFCTREYAPLHTILAAAAADADAAIVENVSMIAYWCLNIWFAFFLCLANKITIDNGRRVT